jgi:hypothetical protein
MNEPLSFTLEQALYWDPCRARDDTGDIVRRDTLAEHGAWTGALRGDLALELGNRSVAQTRCGLIVALALCDL